MSEVRACPCRQVCRHNLSQSNIPVNRDGPLAGKFAGHRVGLGVISKVGGAQVSLRWAQASGEGRVEYATERSVSQQRGN